jgi:hypothetical protein
LIIHDGFSKISGGKIPAANMEHAHYGGLFARLIFGKKPATKHRGRIVRRAPAESGTQKHGQFLTEQFARGLPLAWGRLIRRTAMKLHLIAIATAAALTSGIGAASAADHQAMSNNSAKPACNQWRKTIFR